MHPLLPTFQKKKLNRAFVNVVNVAPPQFHPNSCAFVRSIKIVCQGLNINPITEVFFIVQKG